jgi:hypothetical protein
VDAAKRREVSLRLTLIALASSVIGDGFFRYLGISDHDSSVLIPVLVIAGTMIVSWRAPRDYRCLIAPVSSRLASFSQRWASTD